jgi:predicted AlkP superfamily pyrophosphatase or phosphodiesterase
MKTVSLMLLMFISSFSQKADSYLILISFDGFRYDYQEKAETPCLDSIVKIGVRAKSLVPIFPTKTFTNHYAIATGMYTDKHGLFGNFFYDTERKDFYNYRNRKTVEDGSWYGGEPIWVTAEKQGIKSACMFWVGSEAKIKDIRPSYYHLYDGRINREQRVDNVINWLSLAEEERPRIITLYFDHVDKNGHSYGPDSKELKQAVSDLDKTLSLLTSRIKNLDISDKVNYILVSDHGMSELDGDKAIFLDDIVAFKPKNYLKGLLYAMYDFSGDQKEITRVYKALKSKEKNYKVYTKDNFPKELRAMHKTRFLDLIVVAEEGYSVGLKEHIRFPLPKGMHGYDPNVKNMHGIFYAWGEKFKKNMTIDSFENIHIYPLMTKILSLKNPDDIDGNMNVLKDILISE